MLLHTTTEAGYPAVYINGGSIAARSIYSAQIQANAIIAEHLRAGQISSDHISTAGITADNIKGKTLSSSIPVSSGGSFINLDTGDINFAGGNLTWDNTTKTFYINASTLQIGGKNVLDTDTDLAKQINNKGTTRIQGNKLHFTNQVLMDDTFIELLTANNIFAQKIDARNINANRINSGTLSADFIKGGTFDGQSMIVKNITADAIKGGTFDGQSMTIRNLSADAIVTGTLDMAKFNVANLSADIIKTGNLDITSNLNITAGDTPLLTMSTDNDILTINVNRLKIIGADMATVDDVDTIKSETQTKINKTVKSITEEYYKSTSETTTTGGSWSSSSPTWENGKYIFKRNKITFMDDTVQESTPVNITGTKGSDGNPGQDAYTIILSNESHTFPGSTSNAVASNTVVKVIAYKGATQVASTISSITGLVTGLTAPISDNGKTNNAFTPTATTALTQQNGTLVINLTVDGKSFTKNFSWSVSYTGSSAQLLKLTGDGQVFKVPNKGAITPTTIKVTATGENIAVPTAAANWQYSVDGGTFSTTVPAGLSRTNNIVTVTGTAMTDKSISIRVFSGNIQDIFTVYRIEDGISAYTHIAYSDDDKGTGFSLTDIEKPYLGIYTGDSETPPATPNSYTWSLIKGRDSDAVIKITTPTYPLTTPYTQQNGLVFPTVYGNTKHKVPVGEGRNYFNKQSTIAVKTAGSGFVARGSETPNGFKFTGGQAGTSSVRINNVIDSNGWWTVSFDIKGSQSVPVSVTVDINDLGATKVSTNTTNTYERRSVSVNVTNYPTYNFVDFDMFWWAHFWIDNIKVEKGAVATPYTPAPEDTPQNLLSVGNEVELVSSVGRPNILNHFSGTYSGNNITSSIDSNKNLVIDISSTSNGNYVSFSANPINDEEFQKIKSGTLVTFSIDIKGEKLSSSIAPRFYYGQNMGYYRMIGSVSSEFSRVYITREWSATSLSPHLGFNGMSGRYIIKNAKLEIAAGPSPYSLSPTDISYDIPHPTIYKTNLTLPQPLRSVGEVKDKLFKDNDGVWKIERNVGELSLTGTEAWYTHGVGGAMYQNKFTNINAKTGIPDALSNIVPSTNLQIPTTENVFRIETNTNNVTWLLFSLSSNKFPTVESWKTYLAQNLVKINYQLATPIIETLDKPLQDKLNSLPTYSPETWLYTVNNGKTYLGEEVVPEMEGEFWGAGWAANFRIENNIIPSIDNKAESEALNSLIQTVTTESEKLSSIATDVEVTKNNFLITHTDEYVNKITTTESSIEGLESRIVSVEETKENVDTFFQFDDAFTIGKSNAQTKLRMTNDEIQFLDGETKGTYITGNTMVSQNMQIQDKLNLPKHTFETEGDITVVRYIG